MLCLLVLILLMLLNAIALLWLSFSGFNTSAGHFDPIRLHFAINAASFDKVLELIATGTDLNFAAPIGGQTPLTLSILRRNVDMAMALMAAGADVAVPESTTWHRQPIHLASAAGNTQLVSSILQRCPELVNATDAMLFTPLHYAAIYGHVEVAELLVHSG